MKSMIQIFCIGLAPLFLAAIPPGSLAAPSHTGIQGQAFLRSHKSGIVGSVTGGIIIATPTGEGSGVRPNYVRVYTDTVPPQLVAEVETETQGDVLWAFEIDLKPGRYLLVAYAPPAPEAGGRMFTYPVPVTVEKHEFTEVAPLSFAPASAGIPISSPE